jgi:hypothetical protein
MFDIMNEELEQIDNVTVEMREKYPSGVARTLSKCERHKEMLTTLRGEMTKVILEYDEARRVKFPKALGSEATKTQFYDWHSHYCEVIRAKLFPKKDAFAVIRNEEKAAVLYEQCRQKFCADPKKWFFVMDFAWDIASHELRLLQVNEKGLLIVDEEKANVFTR